MSLSLANPNRRYGPYTNAGAPGAGTDEVQTLTFAETWEDGDTFRLTFWGQTTAAIAWSATEATLLGNIDSALGALASVGGANNVTTAAVSLTDGIGTISVTFVGALAKLAVPTMTVSHNTSEEGTLAVAETTPGVSATLRGAPKGALLVDTTNGVLYQNSGTTTAPTWTKVGTQS